jgi:anti-sigma regulatory factor (Ser/Thr protein kinase)
MAIAATETNSLISLTLPGDKKSANMARFCIRAALAHHNLGGFCADAETVTSELVTNAIEHSGTATLGLEILHLTDSGMIAVIVTDSSADPPVRRDLADDTEHGRGLNIVEALSAKWGWRPEGPGKAVYAILGRESD